MHLFMMAISFYLLVRKVKLALTLLFGGGLMICVCCGNFGLDSFDDKDAPTHLLVLVHHDDGYSLAI